MTTLPASTFSGKPALLGNQPLFAQPVPMVRPHLPGFGDLAAGARGIIESGMVTKGSHLRDFEAAVAAHLRVKHAVAVSSCTTGLMLTYKCLSLTGEVVVPSFTFMATVSALIWAGLRPVFADVDKDTGNLDPACAETAITPATTALVAVHNFGNPADLDALEAVASRHQLPLILDAAHGFGSLFQGRPVGAQGKAQVYSLSPTKLLIAGEGGIVATNDDDLAENIKVGREYGNSGNYDSRFAGINARLPEFNALLGLHSLRMLDQAAKRRNEIATLYRQELGSHPGIDFQEVRPGKQESYKDFSIAIDPETFGLDRDQLARALAAENIDTRKYYDPAVHHQSAYREWAPPARKLPNTDLLSKRSLSLPIWSHMDDRTARTICDAIRRIHDFAPDVKARV